MKPVGQCRCLIRFLFYGLPHHWLRSAPESQCLDTLRAAIICRVKEQAVAEHRAGLVVAAIELRFLKVRGEIASKVQRQVIE